jgi:hypothetical protein
MAQLPQYRVGVSIPSLISVPYSQEHGLPIQRDILSLLFKIDSFRSFNHWHDPTAKDADGSARGRYALSDNTQ